MPYIYRLLFENRKHWLGLSLIIIISLASGVFRMLESNLWGNAIDYGMSGLFHKMLFSVGLMVAVILLDCIRTAFHYHIIGHVTEKMFMEIREKAFHKITKCDMYIVEKDFRHGDLATRLNHDIDELNDFVAADVSGYSRWFFQSVFAAIGCLFLSWQLSIIAFVIIPFSFLLIKKISEPIQTQTKKSLDSEGHAMSIAIDTINSSLTVKAYAIEDMMCNHFNQAVDESLIQKVKSQKMIMKLSAVKYVSSVFQIMALFICGSFFVYNNIMSIGNLIAFITLSEYISDFFSKLDVVFQTIRQATAAAQRFYEVMDIPESLDGNVLHTNSNVSCLAEKLQFVYDDKRGGLHNLNIEIGPNQRVAIVGPSGCGKSTLIKMICRFFLPNEGSMKLFGVESREWNSEKLWENISLVTQEPSLFDGSIYDNISYGRPGVTRDECIEALMEVGMWDHICRYEDGIDHQIGEAGNQLSGGQKQLLCIARAIVKRAPLVLLDEATSALDSQSENEVQIALNKLLNNCSAVIVAHRLATIQNVDYIYYMEEGKILEEGSPRELFSKKGAYYEMCLLQGIKIGEES